MSAPEEDEMECENKEEESDDSDEDSSEDDEEKETEREIELRSRVKQLRIEIANNNLYYDGHVNLIAALRDLTELEEARQAREAMSLVYPLSPELWLEWLKDEQKVCTTSEERKYIISLFDRAVKDYRSALVWVEYIMFMLGGGDIEATRAVGDRALLSVGTHVAEGILVWNVVLLVEKQVYAGMQKPGAVQTEQDKKDQEKQLHKIQNLYRRLSRVPLLNADPQEMLEEVSEFFEGGIEPQMEVDLKKTQKKLEEKIPFEDELLKCENDVEMLAIYRRYIAHTHNTDNPAAVEMLYERAITKLCLDAGLWEEYVRYALHQFQGLDYVVLPVCERSQRNCPWVSSLCALHIRALQLFAAEEDTELHKKIKGALEKGLNCGLQSGSEATKMWMAYLVYLRRSIDWQKNYDTQLETLREACQQAIDMIDSSFGEDGDIDSEIPRFWARIEGESAKAPDRVREIWNDIIMKRNDNFKNASLWLEFINLERSYGAEKHTRKLYRRALERVWDHVEIIGDSYLRFEQEVGTLESMEDFIRRYEDRMVIVKRKRAEDEAKLEAEKQESKSNKHRGKKFDNKHSSFDQHANGHSQEKSDFRVPHQVPRKGKDIKGRATSEPSSFKSNTGHNVSHASSGIQRNVDAPPSFKKNADAPTGYKRDTDAPPGYKGDTDIPPGYKGDTDAPPGYKGDTDAPPGYKGDTDAPPGFKSVAPPPGFQRDVSPPPGFGNAEPPPGVKMDIDAPPGFKRKLDESKDGSIVKKAKIVEEYGALVEKDDEEDMCTAFISNLDFSTDKDKIISLFSGCGEIKDFRLVKDFKQRSKGYGYLVFKSEEGLRKALENDRIPLNGRPVYVSKYDPGGQTRHFKFPTSLEKNKLFVRGLPFNLSQDDVRNVFLPHGEIKDIRLVSYRNGFSKGTCYIEYHDAETADKVRQAMDGKELEGKVINVMISNPAGCKAKSVNTKPTVPTLGGGGSKGTNPAGARKKGMFDLMPRSLMRSSAAATGSSKSDEKSSQTKADEAVKPKSNEDFRKMLLK